MIEEMIPIALFVSISVVVGMIIVFKAKTKQQQQETIRVAIEKGQDLTPELIAQIGSPPQKATDKDLRGALISLAIGGGFLALGFAIPDEEAFGPMAGIASFPILIGVALLVMHFFGSKADR